MCRILYGLLYSRRFALKPDPDRQALIDQTIARFRKLLEEQLPDDNATLDQIEQAIDKIGKGILPDLQ